MQKKTIRVIVPCLAVIMAFAVAAAEIYVDPVVGTDAVGSGAAAVPFKTVGYALGRASAGDTIRLAAGIYSAAGGETFPIAFSSTKAHVRLMGALPRHDYLVPVAKRVLAWEMLMRKLPRSLSSVMAIPRSPLESWEMAIVSPLES